MHRLKLFCFIINAVFTPQFAFALEMTDLYEAEVPVADQRAAARSIAARAALAEVLIKVTGNAAAASQPKFQPLLQQADQWLQRYQYRATPAGATPQALVASFNRQAINQRLYDAGLPVWGHNRPKIVVWLTVEDGGRSVVGGDQKPELQALLAQQARRRGLPVIFPRMDAQDQKAVGDSPAAQPVEALLRASERYQGDGVLMGRVYAVAPNRWRAQWTLRHAGSTRGLEGGEGALAEVAAAGIDAVAGQLAQHYALVLKPGVSGTATLMVGKVRNVQDYARVSRYLGSLDAVSAVAVESVEGNTVVYRLQIRGELHVFTQLVALGNVLEPFEGSTPPATGELEYQLMP